FVDTGNYVALTDIEWTAQDSGAQGNAVTVQGPTAAAHAALIDRVNTESANTVVMRFTAAHDIEIRNIDMKNAQTGVSLASNANDARISIVGSEISNVRLGGVFLGTGNSGFSIDSSRIFGGIGTTSVGIELNSTSTVTNTEVFGYQIGIRTANAFGSGT